MKAVAAGLTFVFNVLLARLLGADGLGIYYIGRTVVTIGSVIGRVGLDYPLLRYVSVGVASNDWEAVKGVHQRGILLAFVVSAALTGLIVVTARWLSLGLFNEPGLVVPLRWMAVSVIPFAVLNLYAESLKGLREILNSQLIQVVGVPALSLVTLYYFVPRLGVTGAAVGYLLATTLTAAAGAFIWRLVTPQLRGVVGQFQVRRLITTSFPLLGMALTNLAMNWTATLVLGVSSSSKEVGVFRVASRTAVLTSYVLVAGNTVAAAKFATLYERGDINELAKTARNTAKLLLLVASPLLFLGLVFPRWILAFFGPEFVSGAPVLMILMIGQFINVGTGLVADILIMSGNERIATTNFVVVTLFNIVLCLAIIPTAGIIGAAIVTSASLVINNLALAIHVRRRIGVWTLPCF